MKTLNESPSEKEGKSLFSEKGIKVLTPSMKVPPKRKGNFSDSTNPNSPNASLNESPSEKEGKSHATLTVHSSTLRALNESPSEKEGKCFSMSSLLWFTVPQ